MTEIIVSVVTGVLTLIGVCVTAWASAKKTKNDVLQEMDKVLRELDKKQGIMERMMDELTREVRTHNGFAQRIPAMEEQMKELYRRTEKLEKENALLLEK